MRSSDVSRVDAHDSEVVAILPQADRTTTLPAVRVHLVLEKRIVGIEHATGLHPHRSLWPVGRIARHVDDHLLQVCF